VVNLIQVTIVIEMKLISSFRKHLPFFVFVIIVCLIQFPLLIPFFTKGFFTSHDNDAQIIRIFEYYQSLHFGDIPPRWSANLLFAHGYPLYVFYPPFAYLLGSVFVFAGINFLAATKLTFILSFVVGAVGVFVLLKKWFGTIPGFAGTLLFSLAPYRAVDVYIRGNLAEFFAFSFFPWVFWANSKLLENTKSKKYRTLFGVLLTIQLLSHNVSSFIYLAFLAFYNFYYVLCNSNKKQMLFSLTCSFLLAIALSCFYWLPLLYEYQFVRLSNFADYPYQQYFLTFSQIWQSPWGYGSFTVESPMSLQLGQVLIVLSFIAFILNLFIKTKLRNSIYLFFLVFIGSTFLETKNSQIIWDKITILHFMQFPWRLHILTTLCATMLSASIFYLLTFIKILKPLKNIPIFGLLIIVTFLSFKESYSFFRAKSFFSTPSISQSTTWDDEYLPTWVQKKPTDFAKEKVIFTQGSGKIKNVEWGYLVKKFNVESAKNGKIEIAHIYYPGWQAFINGNQTPISYANEKGLMTITVPAGENVIEFSFKRTWWRTLSELISLTGLFVVIFIAIKNKKR
jgi:uncharacterized membrane protein